MEIEGKKSFLNIGENFKTKIMEAGSSMEPFVMEVLSDVRVERNYLPNISNLFMINFPNFEMESLIFNTNLNTSCMQSFCQSDPFNGNNQMLPRSSNGALQMPMISQSPSAIRITNLGNTPQNFNKGFQQPDNYNFASTPKSMNNKGLGYNSSSTTNLYANNPKGFNFGNFTNTEPTNNYIEMTPNNKNFEKKLQGQLLTCNTPSNKYISNQQNYNDQMHSNYKTVQSSYQNEEINNYKNSKDQVSARQTQMDSNKTNFVNNILDSRAFHKDDNLLLEMSLQDIPELNNQGMMKQMKTQHFDNYQVDNTRVTQNFAKSSNGTPRNINSNNFSKTMTQQTNIGTTSARNLMQVNVKHKETTEKFDKSARSSFKSTNAPSNISSSRKVEKVQTSSKKVQPTKNKDNYSARSKDLCTTPRNVSRDRSIDKKTYELEKSKALKQLLVGKTGEQLKDLKSNKLLTLDLSNNSTLIRSKRLAPCCHIRLLT